MQLDEGTLKEAELIIDKLYDPVVENLAKEHDESGEATKEGLKDFLYEDYAYVLPLLKAIGISTIRATEYCDDCDDEMDVKAEAPAYEFHCPKCGNLLYTLLEDEEE